MKFRKDINGLRAFAVIAVVLFHFNSDWMPGGFAGVDVFFVISGFLMTGIIFRGLENNNFSVLNFYVARANRIIPALATLCLVLLVFGWFYLTPLEYKALGKHAASSVTFFSNITYWLEAGYFDSASHEKWLLHTWSLSVEWQFYIIYPLVLIALKRVFSLKTVKLLIIAGTVIGFIFSVYATYRWPNASYYLFPMRAWEMMMGGIAFLYPITFKDKSSKIVEAFGLCLVLGSYVLITGTDPWPGYLSLFPVLGTFLVIQAQCNDSLITGNIISQKLGAWSYSIYLWHWPLVVTIYTYSLPDKYIYVGIALSILLGFLSYKFIEKINFRRNFPTVLSCFKSIPIYIATFVGLLGSLAFVKYDAFSTVRLNEQEHAIIKQQERNKREKYCGKVIDGVSPGCTYGDGPVKAIVIGDSHANAQVVAIGERAELHGGSIKSFGLDGCPTIKNVYSFDSEASTKDNNCGLLVANSIKESANEYPGIPVIIINRVSSHFYGNNELPKSQNEKPAWFVNEVFELRDDNYRKDFENNMLNTICEFSKNNPVYLTRPTPELKFDVPKTMFRSSKYKGYPERVRISRSEYDKRHYRAYTAQDKAVENCGANILDPIPYLCDSKFCYGDKNGIPLYFDDDHLSNYGSKLISPIYDEVFR